MLNYFFKGKCYIYFNILYVHLYTYLPIDAHICIYTYRCREREPYSSWLVSFQRSRRVWDIPGMISIFCHSWHNAAGQERGLFGPLKLSSPLTPEKIRIVGEDKFTKMVCYVLFIKLWIFAPCPYGQVLLPHHGGFPWEKRWQESWGHLSIGRADSPLDCNFSSVWSYPAHSRA